MLGKEIGHFSDEKFQEAAYIDKIRKLAHDCKRESIPFEGTLYEDELYITCFINDYTDLIYKKEKGHVYLRFSVILETKPEENEEYKKLTDELGILQGAIKQVYYIPQGLYLLDIHILDKKFTETIKLISNFISKVENDLD